MSFYFVMETKGLKKTLTRDILVTLDLDGIDMIQDLKYLYLKIIRLAPHRHKMI